MEFTATESGFENGLGGAANSAASAEYHYVLFGKQTDAQYPEESGIYFEFDDQIHGAVDCVNKIVIADAVVEFELKEQTRIVVRRGMEAAQWDAFLRGIRDVFGDDVILKG